MSNNRVLMIDDDPDTLSLYSIIANKLGLGQYFTAVPSGDAALRFLETTDFFPDVILVDINMDGMNGFQFLKRYETIHLEAHSDTTVIVLSSSVRESDRSKALSFTCIKEFISKPLLQAKLKELMQSAVYHHIG